MIWLFHGVSEWFVIGNCRHLFVDTQFDIANQLAGIFSLKSILEKV